MLADLQWMRLESLTIYHLLFFETGFFGTAEDDPDRAAAAEGGKCSLGTGEEYGRQAAGHDWTAAGAGNRGEYKFTADQIITQLQLLPI